MLHPMKHAHGSYFVVFCCGLALVNFSTSFRFTSLAQRQSLETTSETTLNDMSHCASTEWDFHWNNYITIQIHIPRTDDPRKHGVECQNRPRQQVTTIELKLYLNTHTHIMSVMNNIIGHNLLCGKFCHILQVYFTDTGVINRDRLPKYLLSKATLKSMGYCASMESDFKWVSD